MFGCFFFKQKTAYEMRISYWSSDVCSSDLDMDIAVDVAGFGLHVGQRLAQVAALHLVAVLGVQRQVLFDFAGMASVGSKIVKHGTSPVWMCVEADRSEERRVWEECVRTCSSRGLMDL